MKNHTNKSRREFLKKTAYVVPTIVALGTFTTPVMAGGSCIQPQHGGNGKKWQNNNGHANGNGPKHP